MSELYFPPPGDDWERMDPASIGWNAGQLSEAVAFAGQRNSSGFIVLHKGRILAEAYWQGAEESWTQHVASCQKSIVSFLIGIAIAEGRLTLEDPVHLHLGRGWSACTADQEAAITLRHLVTLTSGLDEDLAYEAEPGTTWRYNNAAYFRAKAVLEAATGVSTAVYSRRHLWDPLGIAHAKWEILSPEEPVDSVRMSLRDMARFGLLMLADGVWAGRPLPIDRAYLAASLEISQELNLSYGYLWWLNSGASYVFPGGKHWTFPGPIIPTAPADLFAALGQNDKKIYVCPSRELVVARLGDLAALPGAMLYDFDTDLWRALLAAAPP